MVNESGPQRPRIGGFGVFDPRREFGALLVGIGAAVLLLWLLSVAGFSIAVGMQLAEFDRVWLGVAAGLGAAMVVGAVCLPPRVHPLIPGVPCLLLAFAVVASLSQFTDAFAMPRLVITAANRAGIDVLTITTGILLVSAIHRWVSPPFRNAERSS